MNSQAAGPGLFVGLTGGIGSGKSTVASFFEERHPVLYADRIARECMEHDEQLRTDLIQLFGIQVFLSDGSLDRRWLAEVVFNNAHKLTSLNAVVHPPTHQRILDSAERLFTEGASMVFVESALIYEARLEDDFDYVVSVLSDPEVAVSRIAARDGSDPAAVRSRMQHQIAPEEKSALADFTIRNTGSLDDLRRSSDLILTILSTLRPRRS